MLIITMFPTMFGMVRRAARIVKAAEKYTYDLIWFSMVWYGMV